MEIAGILFLAALAWLWLDSVHARDVAVRAAREVCTADGMMLLDDTVAISSLRLARNDDGHVRIQRAYDFEYSSTGDNRLKGSLVMLGHRVTVLSIGPRPAPHLRVVH